MTNQFRLLAAAAVAAIALISPGLRAQETAPAAPPAQSDYSQEIKALRAQLDQLEVRQKEAEAKRLEAQRELEQRVTADDLARVSLQKDQFMAAEGFTAGYTDGHFVLQSSDGNFTLSPWAHFQFRAVALDREGVQGNKIEGPEDEWDTGFEVRRMRLGFNGNFFSPELTYFFNWNTYRSSAASSVSGTTAGATVNNNQGGVFFLEEAWVKYHIPASDFSVQLGQLRDPVLHDQIVDARFQQSAERSITADLFANGDGFTEGVMAIYDPKTWVRAEAGVNHGMRSANTNFLSYPNNGSLNEFNYGLAGRVEFKATGHWKDYNQVGNVGIKDPLLVAGVGADYSERGHAGQLVAAADLTYADPMGFNFYGAVVDRYTTHSFGLYSQSSTGAVITTPGTLTADKATNEYSLLVQGGYLFSPQIEVFGRYEYIKLQGDANGARNYVQAITGGANYFFHENRLKLTTEIVWLPVGLPVDDSSSDVLANSTGRGEISLIVQVQLAL